METSLPKFSRAAQKILVAQNLGGLQPPSPPRPVRLCICSPYLLNVMKPVPDTNNEPGSPVVKFITIHVFYQTVIW